MRKISIFLFLVMFLFLLNSCGEKQEYYTPGLKFTEYEEYCSVAKGEVKDVEHIVIPRMYNKKPVTIIDQHAFYGCSKIEKVDFPDTLKEIRESAFEKCENLTEINLPDSIESIGKRAFWSCGAFDTVVLPLNIKYLGARALSSTTHQIVVQDASTFTYIGGEVFYEADYVYVLKNEFQKTFNFSEYWDNSGIFIKANILYNIKSYNNTTSDGLYRYYVQSDKNEDYVVITKMNIDETSVKIYTIPSQIAGKKVIDVRLEFYYTKDYLRALVIEENASFYNNLELSTLNCPILFKDDGKNYKDKGVKNCKEVFYDEELKLLWATMTNDENNVKIIKSYLEEELEELVIPEQINGKNVVEICVGAYNGVKTSKLILPKYLKVIGDAAFSNSDVAEIIFNDELTDIGDSAFYKCQKLNNVILPKSLKSLGESCFRYCYGLNNLVLNEGLESIGTLCFYGSAVPKDIKIPDSVTYIGKDIFKK